MKNKFQFTRLDMALLITNSLVLGACIVLLLLGRASGPLVLLTIGASGMLAGKLISASRSQRSKATLPTTEEQPL